MTIPTDPNPPGMPQSPRRPLGIKPKRKRRTRTAPVDPFIKAALRVGKRHRKRFAPSREEAERMARAYRLALIPRRKPGVEADPETAKGAEIYIRAREGYDREGMPPSRAWPLVYRATIPGFEEMDLADRQYHSNRVRNNVKAYLRRRGVKFAPHKRTRRNSGRTNRGGSTAEDRVHNGT